MIYPAKQSARSILAILKSHGIKHIIITPGSRNAPLTIGFTEDSYFKSYSIVDERSAAFFALGIAQQTKEPSVLLCTSGSALLNYYPAVSEAYYSNIPLIVISADRPKEWIDQADGQTIRQDGVLDKHLAKSVSLIDSEKKDDIWFNERKVNELINISIDKSLPVHINVPFAEPLYETIELDENKARFIRIPKVQNQLEVSELETYAKQWNESSKKIVLVGSNPPDKQLQLQIDKLAKDPSVLILTESTSNVKGENLIYSIDKLINNMSNDQINEFKPDILITIGGMIVSKKIKALLRSYIFEHWHVGNEIEAPDTYQNLSAVFRVSTDMFFSQLFFLYKEKESNYRDTFLKLRDKRNLLHDEFLQKAEFSDLKVFDIITKKFKNIQLQSGNSSVVRYFQLFHSPDNWDVYCNRGTSGIDGSTSTAIGAAVASEKDVLLVSGDISFFYDSNAWWNKYIPKNFKAILINNGGGSIFKIIPGPSKTKAAKEFFQTEHSLNARNLAEMHGINYLRADNEKDLIKALERFVSNNEKASILEINTAKSNNEEVLKQYWEYLDGK